MTAAKRGDQLGTRTGGEVMSSGVGERGRAPPRGAPPPRRAASRGAPPSRSRSPSRQPPLPPPIMLHVAIRLALPHPRQPEVELLDVLVLADRLRVAVEHDPSALHDVAVLRKAQRDRRVLLGEQQ